MLRKIIVILILVAGIFASCLNSNISANEAKTENNDAQGESEGSDYAMDMANKLGRGTADTATFWAEIPQGIIDVSKKDGPLAGLTVGLAEGLGSSLAAGLDGLYEMFTFYK